MLCDRDSGLDVVHRAATALFGPPSAFAFGAREVVAPAVVFGASDLGVDEAIDGLVADAGVCPIAGEASGDLLG